MYKAMDMRGAFFDEVYRLAKQDSNVVFLTDDMDAFSLDKFRCDMPERFINVGCAEQNLINVAAGLAMAGKKVFAYGICSFVTSRCYEQIRVNISSMELPVVLVGVGPGFSFSFDGPTHHGLSDIALMKTIPEMRIWNPSDGLLAKVMANTAYSEQTDPIYIRLDKGDFPDLTEDYKFYRGYRIIRPISDCCNIITTGNMVGTALELLKHDSVWTKNAGVIDVFDMKGIQWLFDYEPLRNTKHIVVLEENSKGMYSDVCEEVCFDRSNMMDVVDISVTDRQIFSYGSRKWMQKESNLNVEQIIAFIGCCLDW